MNNHDLPIIPGDIVFFYPGTGIAHQLPNDMQLAPAMVLQVNYPAHSGRLNLLVFHTGGTTSYFAVMHKKHPMFEGNEGCAYWIKRPTTVHELEAIAGKVLDSVSNS